MLRKVALRCSEYVVVVGPLECWPRMDATDPIESVATILLHNGFLA